MLKRTCSLLLLRKSFFSIISEFIEFLRRLKKKPLTNVSCICVRVYQLNQIVLRLLIFYVYEFRRIQTRGEFNIYFRRSRDFFQSMVIP